MKKCCGRCPETASGERDCICEGNPRCPAYIAEVFSEIRVEMIQKLIALQESEQDPDLAQGKVSFPISGDHLYLTPRECSTLQGGGESRFGSYQTALEPLVFLRPILL